MWKGNSLLLLRTYSLKLSSNSNNKFQLQYRTIDHCIFVFSWKSVNQPNKCNTHLSAKPSLMWADHFWDQCPSLARWTRCNTLFSHLCYIPFSLFLLNTDCLSSTELQYNWYPFADQLILKKWRKQDMAKKLPSISKRKFVAEHRIGNGNIEWVPELCYSTTFALLLAYLEIDIENKWWIWPYWQ